MTVNIYFMEALLTVVIGVFTIGAYLLNSNKRMTRSLVDDAVSPLSNRLTIIETKVDVFWQRMAIDMARTLHHPEESRTQVDLLLDKFMDGTLEKDEVPELKHCLEIIREWEPGSPAPFTVYQGEQVAAAILLHTMDHTLEERSRRNG